ncbi:MAG: 30S ribosomal protein S17 [Nanoarchaeota archaeon]
MVKRTKEESSNVERADEAQEPGSGSTCTDGNCPVHGRLRLHGRHFTGLVTSARMRRTANIVIEKTQFIRKYERYERRLSNIKVHNPECISAREGDKVEVFECRPLSKTKHFVITKKL